MGVLRSRSGDRQVVLSAVHVVGRLQSCTLPLSSAFVSTAHAMIRWDGRAWSVRDLGSRNGTYVNEAVIPKGEAVPLRRGTRIAFGATTETWELVNAGRPEPAVIPLDGGEPIFLTHSVTGIPSLEEPVATIYNDGDAWLLEHDDTVVEIESGAQFVIGGRPFRFDCPSGASETVTSTEQEWSLERLTLMLDVSPDQEHVSLSLRNGDRTKDLGERASFYMMLVLARERLRGQATDGAAAGWVTIDALLRMIPDYSSATHVNVEIFRLRRLLAGADVGNAAGIIERRRNQIRLGTDRLEIRAISP